MSDEIANAVALNKKLAATLLMKKEELEAAVAKGGGEEIKAELASIEQQLQAAMKEIAELKRLAQQRGGMSAVKALMDDDDPLTPSLEQAALERARQGISELDAEAELGSAQPPATPKLTAEEQARQEFEKLQAEKKPVKRSM